MRPTMEISEEMEVWARWCLYGGEYPLVTHADVARFIINSIPQPPCPLAVGDVVDRWESYLGSGPEPRKSGWGVVKVIDSEHRIAVIQNDADGSWSATPCRVYRRGETEPAPWPWETP